MKYDAVIIGSGPNGLSAGITLARQGLSVKIFEAKDTIGGGMRSAELTLPGFIHDVCSAVHPLGASSPFMKTLPLEKFGLQWLYPHYALSHLIDVNTSVEISRSIEETSASLGEDSKAYSDLLKPFIAQWDELANEILGPLRFPKSPILLLKFVLKAIRSAKGLSHSTFKSGKARALLQGVAAHSMLPLDKITTAAIGLVLLTLAYKIGWPVAKGGSGCIANAMCSYFTSLGGEIETNAEINSLDELPGSKAVLLDVTPKQIIKIGRNKLPQSYINKLQRYKYGPGIFKIDWALKERIPFISAGAQNSVTVHVGGTEEEVFRSEQLIHEGKISDKPYIILAQHSIIDSSRAPGNRHTAWAYCHTPAYSTLDLTNLIENRVEEFAPGFKELIIGRNTMNSKDVEAYNPNYIGGDINGGLQDITQLFTRPVISLNPYKTPVKGIYICSSSTPPGGGVHGMCGYHAARNVLKDLFNIKIEKK